MAWGVRPVKRSGDEPVAELGIVKWIEDQGVDAITEFEVTRGKLADFRDVMVRSRSTRQSRITKPPRNAPEFATRTDFVTGELVVDISGGGPPPLARYKLAPPRPVQIVTLDSAGNLIIHDELDDRRALDAEQAAAEPLGPASKPSKSLGVEEVFSDEHD